MLMTPYSGDVEIITNIGTTPQERGLSTDEFKAKFDEGLKAFVTWFNDTHKTEFDALQVDAIPQIGFAKGKTSNPATASATYVDLPDMSVTMTTTGGDVLVLFFGVFQNSGAGNMTSINLYADAAGDGFAGCAAPAADYTFNISTMAKFTGLSAASHTFKVKYAASAGTTTASGTSRYMLVIEL